MSAENLRAHLEAAMASGKLVLLDPLPRRVRHRLWRHAKVDHLASWLVERGQFRAAISLWRAFGLWEA